MTPFPFLHTMMILRTCCPRPEEDLYWIWGQKVNVIVFVPFLSGNTISFWHRIVILDTCWQWSLLVPYRLAGGTLSLLAVCQSVCPSVTLQFSRLFSAVFWEIDLKFSIWICHDIIQIKFDFRHAWPTFTGVIALCYNLVFRTFLCSLLRYWLEI